MIRVALVGQPNCGKSTVFNCLVGYRAYTSNFTGTTVECLRSTVAIGDELVEIIDLPGTYSLTPLDAAERATQEFLLPGRVDAVLNVVDACTLVRSLELTLQLLELGLPLVVCLNMQDEARRRGIAVDPDELSRRIGVPVVPAVARRCLGIDLVAQALVSVVHERRIPPFLRYGQDVEEAIRGVEDKLSGPAISQLGFPPRFVAVKLLEGDPHIVELVQQHAPSSCPESQMEELVRAERHQRALEIFRGAVTVRSRGLSAGERLDGVVMHPVWGVILFAAVMYGLFYLVFHVGSWIEAPVIAGFDRITVLLGTVLTPQSLAFYVTRGLIQGVGGAVGIVIPYLVPFVAGLSVLEDIGYLSRAGFLMDGVMERLGLHGKAVVPLILGYGCSVPAVMATRILHTRRDRFVTAMLAVMIPCVARTTILFGLVGRFVGPSLALGLYAVNLLVVGAAGRVLRKILPESSSAPGFLLEIPSYKAPLVRVILSKVWLRVKEFLILALPILAAGSVLLSLLTFAKLDRFINLGLLPITWSLGLPLAVGFPLVFGIFRKELSLVMLFQAFGTTALNTVLTGGQMVVFTLFVLFYVPCLATLAVLAREFGWRQAAIILLSTTAIGLLVALAARGIAQFV